jgi:hypothetical protein
MTTHWSANDGRALAGRTDSATVPDARTDLGLIRQPYCIHRLAARPDVLSIGWPRDPVCLKCGAVVDPARYDADAERPGLRHLRCEEGAA